MEIAQSVGVVAAEGIALELRQANQLVMVHRGFETIVEFHPISVRSIHGRSNDDTDGACGMRDSAIRVVGVLLDHDLGTDRKNQWFCHDSIDSSHLVTGSTEVTWFESNANINAMINVRLEKKSSPFTCTVRQLAYITRQSRGEDAVGLEGVDEWSTDDRRAHGAVLLVPGHYLQ